MRGLKRECISMKWEIIFESKLSLCRLGNIKNRIWKWNYREFYRYIFHEYWECLIIIFWNNSTKRVIIEQLSNKFVFILSLFIYSHLSCYFSIEKYTGISFPFLLITGVRFISGFIHFYHSLHFLHWWILFLHLP